ncbi:interaptin-like isoform x1 [Plakobranchus ocellatus]|uniref:Interaptin-like isoform x1 n=1 Tax=Plakobranchus ocellatus TaxID=259542 RepID=A0AAV4E216_9GAST|nr:interaptin-like isoform x1 [Plakobranchus ocellatus]
MATSRSLLEISANEVQQRPRSATPSSLVKTSLSDMKSYLVEKEMMESQMRKLSLENSTLQMENKLMRDKYNRAIARASELEAKLQEVQEELTEVQMNMEEESGRLRKTARAEMEREVEQYQAKATSSAKDAEILKSELSLLEDQLASLKSENEALKSSMDKRKSHEAHKQEVNAFQEEISKLKRVLAESESRLEAESERCRDLSSQVHNLTEIKDVLQLRLSESGTGGSAADKQVAALQMRLKVTEERLTQERSDRAGNLSQVEEKLLSENAKLQTKEKELERQLKREKEKTRSLELRANQFREENLQLRLAVPDEDEQDYDIPFNKHSNQRHDSKKPAYDMDAILRQLEKESGLSGGDGANDPLVMYLWEQRADMRTKIKAWRLYLDQLELLPTESGDGGGEEDGLGSLQSALAIKTEYEAKMLQTEEKYEDISAERITAEQTYKQQLADLVKERHDTFARLKTLEDLLEALRAENEMLRHGLASSSSWNESGQKTVNVDQDQVENLHEQIASLEAKVSHLNRTSKVAETEMSTLRNQLASRDKQLAEALSELSVAQASTLAAGSADDHVKQQRIQALSNEVASLKQELHHKSERLSASKSERNRLETELDQTNTQLRAAKKQSREQNLGSSLTQRQEIEKLEAELEKKDAQILKLTGQVNETESTLHMAQTETAMLQQTQQAMDAQLESIQRQLDQRCQVLDELTAREGEQLEQVDMVKGMVHSLNSGLHTKQGEIDVLQLELHQAKEKIARLEDQKSKLSARIESSASASSSLVGEDGTEGNVSHLKGAVGGYSSTAATDLRVSEVEMEKEELQTQLLQSTSTASSLRHELESVTAETNTAMQQASFAEAELAKLSSEKAVVERHLQRTEEEHQMAMTERDTCKHDLEKLEDNLHQIVTRFDEEAKDKFDSFTSEYHDDSPQSQKMIGEMQTLRVLTFAKEKEGASMMDKIKRQELELINLNRKCELLQAESDHSRADVSRITNELVLKIKENSGSMEVNRLLLREQSGLQRKVVSLETQLAQEKERTERRKAEVADVIKKIEHSEQAQLSTSLTLQQKDSIIGDQEVRLRQLTSDLNQTESQRDALKVKVDQLTEDVRNLSNVTNGMEKKLETKEASIREEQNLKSKQREEIQSLTHKLELLKNEQNLLLGNLSTERKVQDKLKGEIKSHEGVEKKLNERIAELTGELETQKGQLVAARETLEQTKAQKEAFMKDYQDACRRLGEKEAAMIDLRKKQEVEVMQMKEETLKSSQSADLEKANKERGMEKLKEEIETLKQQLERKETQLSSYSHTLKELEDAQKKTKELEAYGADQEKVATEARILIDSLRSELLQLRETNSELQDTVARKEVAVLDLKDQLRSSGESGEAQVTEMRHTIDGMRSHHEYEKKALREALTKVEESLKASVKEVRALTDQRDQLTNQCQTQERAFTEVNYKLSQEVAARKVSEEKLDQTKENAEELRKKKYAAEERASNLQISLSKSESEYNVLKERGKTLATQLRDTETALNISEAALKAAEDKVEALKTDLMRQQQMLESYKQQSSSKLRKLNLELKQQIDSQEKDQLKLHQQGHQLSVDLEKAREAVAIKNKENLKLQERVLELEDDVREGETKLKQMQDSLKHEEEMQTRLSYRKQKSRMEEINEIIARSQTRAQALMASGEFSQSLEASSLRNLNPSRDYRVGGDLGNSPGSFSPDQSSVTSDASFSSANLANLSFLNLSGSYGTSPFTQKK